MTVTLASQSLPNPSEYPMADDTVGEYIEMAGGTMKFRPYTATGIRKTWRVTWPALTSTQLATARTAHAAALLAGVTWAPPEGGSFTVITTGPLQIDPVKVLSGTRYRVTIALAEAL